MEKGQLSTTRVLVERGAKPRRWTLWKAEKHPELLAYLEPAAARAPCPKTAQAFDISSAEEYQKALAARGSQPLCLYLPGAKGVILLEGKK